MEKFQKQLYRLESGVVESEVILLPKLKDVLSGLMVGKGVAQRKIPMVEIKKSGCWEWTGKYVLKGYAFLFIDGKRYRVHRYFYQMFKGQLSKELVIDHLCRNRGCCNPDHLEQVTNKENILRGLSNSAENLRKTHCKNGHLFTGERNHQGFRFCRICENAYQREKYKNLKIVELEAQQ